MDEQDTSQTIEFELILGEEFKRRTTCSKAMVVKEVDKIRKIKRSQVSKTKKRISV